MGFNSGFKGLIFREVEEKALLIDCPEEGENRFLRNRVLNSYFIIFNAKMETTWNSLGGIVFWTKGLKENFKPTVMLHRFLDLHHYYHYHHHHHHHKHHYHHEFFWRKCVSCEVLAAVLMKIQVLCYVRPNQQVRSHWCFGGTLLFGLSEPEKVGSVPPKRR